jgi:putative acetyltransferase
MRIRQIQLEDNPQIAQVIRNVFVELDAPKVGTAFADPILDTLFEVYQMPKSIYFVIENEGLILGGCGIAPLENSKANICELQKMYFAPHARGLGLGYEVIQLCLEFAIKEGFTNCYLETLPYMTAAQKLYQKVGFHHINGPLGNTGHSSCDVWMLKKLT